jgi:hypothetical protein
MLKKPSLRKRIDIIFRALKAKHSRSSVNDLSGPKKDRAIKKLNKLLAKSSAVAFEKAGLDVDKDEHWRLLTLLFCAAVYGGPGRGHPKKWSTKKLRRLLADIGDVKAEHSTFSEEKSCGELIRKNGKQYNKVTNARTLRRLLQVAKRQQSLSREIASLKSVELLAGVPKLNK